MEIRNVIIGSQGTATFRITNKGKADLLISSISSDRADFTVNLTTATISPYDSLLVTVTFQTAADGARNALITIKSNDIDEGTLTISVSSTIGCALPGDVTAEGRVDIFDILTIVRFALGVIIPKDYQQVCADINADGRIDIFDVLACVNKALGRTLQLAAYSQTDIAQLDLAQLNSDLVSLGAEPELIADIFQILDQNQPVPSLPKAFSLGQNSPNPFNPSTTISYSVPEGPSVKISLKIYDLRGRLVRTLVEEMREPGSYSVFWDGRDGNGQQLSSGVYLYRMRAGEFVQTRKMVLLK